ncbi:PLC-like phosphodiesterase [Neocallimastix californiae]|uniref:PLC-like phosphodiesterase n=1 Tax=Neocallimastix californiae TaxID=1754190 RepID=A0A1Y2BPB7_9FUNG|nr:PLC-like phosphodiesterase [Neocallimastix californiae]|eukprot:ORY36566.1 PLC-like phosphodiesterase [Neocallimastix californiae]
MKGDAFNQKTCISANSRLWYFSSTDPCEWTYYLSPSNRNEVDNSASCNEYGCLTKFGWIHKEYTCYYNKDPVIDDANWMSYLDQNLKINQIIISGTHDSGTYDIDDTNIFTKDTRRSMSKTQNFDISDQLEMGIRFLDLRLEINEK